MVKAKLTVQWLNPSDYPSDDRFLDAYKTALAEVKVAEKFLSQFDPVSIEERIKDLRKQILREEGKNAG